MKFFGGPRISVGRFFFCGEIAQGNFLAAVSYHCAPVSVCRDPMDALMARRVVLLRPLVPRIFVLIGGTKILPSIIRGIAVNVIDLLWRPLPDHQRVSDTVRQMRLIIHRDLNVAEIVHRPRDIARQFFAALFQPRQGSRLWIVLDERAQFLDAKGFRFWGDAGIKNLSHLVLLKRWWLGFRPGAANAPGTREYYAGTWC